MDFTSIFNGEALTLEQFAQRTKDLKLADLSKGEYVAKGKYEDELKKARDDLAIAKDTINTLEASKGDSAALQAELDKYKAAEEERIEAEKAAAAKAALTERFKAVKGELEFSHEYIEQGVMADFEKAINDPENTGKGDAELFSTLTRDKEGIFKSKNPPINMGGFGSTSEAGSTGIPTFF